MPDWIPTAMELRHPSWDDPAVYAILEQHHAAYVVMSGAGLTCVPRATSDLVYIRMHGPPQDSIYAGSYTDDELRRWAGKLAGWHDEGRRVLVYFNNDLGGHAIRNARKLKELLGLDSAVASKLRRMTKSSTFAIVGGGLAGAKAAEALRDKDFDGHIVLFAAEEHLPYERPPLSKEFLHGKKQLSDFTAATSVVVPRSRRRAATREPR